MDKNKNYIFCASTPAAYLIKGVAEILQTTLKTSCFQLKHGGLYLRQMDENRSTLIDLTLNAENFEVFYFSKPRGSSIFIGLTLTHLYKLLRTAKKKDSIKLYILETSPNEIGIEVRTKGANRVTTSFLKIQQVQNILVDIPIGYNAAPVDIHSHEFQKIYKDILSIGKTVKISTAGGKIQFDVDAGSIVKRRVEYGDVDGSREEKNRYAEVFDTSQLVKLSKISNLSSMLNVYTEPNLPFLIKSSIGDIGHISIFVKTRTQLQT